MDFAVPFRSRAEQEDAENAFGVFLAGAQAYARLLADQGVAWGLLGPREVERLWSRHLLNSAALTQLVPEGVDLLDIGSGAGLPGIPLRLARPDLRVTLVEPLQRRVRFLELCRRELGLPDLSVVTGRAERLGGQRAAQTVTARAVAPLPRLLVVAWPLVRVGGQLLAVKGRNAESELASCAVLPDDLAAPPDVVRRYDNEGEPLVTVVRFQRNTR